MMKKLMLFEEFHSVHKKNILTDILDALEDDIDDLMMKYEASFKKVYDKKMSDYDKEITRLTIISDMVKSIGNYTKPDDKLKSINSKISPKGNLEISAIITRDGQDYPLETEVIYAGGHNIQVLHYRYITKTKLPKGGKNEMYDEYQKRIKKLNATEKLMKEIENYKLRIENNQKRIDASKDLSDEEIFDLTNREGDRKTEWPTWAEMIDRGADKNYNYSEEEFNKAQEEYRQSKIDFWKNQNIVWPKTNNASLMKEIVKLEKKLAAL